MLEVICVPVIVILVYGIIEIYKKFIPKDKPILISIIPIISAMCGGILGTVGYFIVPSIIIADNVGVAVLIGVCSGLSATGTNQIFKQFKKIGVEVQEVEVAGITDKKDDANDKSN